MAGKPIPALKGYITISEAAQKWSCSAQQVRRYIARELVEGAKLDPSHGIAVWRIPRAAKRPHLPKGRRKASEAAPVKKTRTAKKARATKTA